MKKILTLIAVVLVASTAHSQSLFMTRNGQVAFHSKTPMENIDAVNNEVTSMINGESGELVFALLVKSFHFDRALMEEHFNENYMESSKLPKASFQGKITNLQEVNFKKDGTYSITVAGDLTIHGVKKAVQNNGTLTVSGTTLTINATFAVTPADYNIAIPKLVAEKIAESIEVVVNCRYTPKQ